MSRRTKFSAAAIMAGLTLAGCGTASSSGPGAVSSQHSVLRSAEADPSVKAAIDKAKRDVINPCIDGSTGVSSFIACAKGKVPKSQRETVGKCLVKGALAAKKGHTTYEVEQALISTIGPACIAPALP